MALAHLTINLDAFTGDDRPPLSSYSTITLDPGADHIDAAADVIHVRTIVVSLDRQGKAATANGVPCVDGRVPVVAGVAYAVSAPNILRGGPYYIPALTAGQVVALSDYITPGAPLTPDQAASLTARIVALEPHTQYALADGTRGAFAAPLGPDDNYVTDAEKAALHAHSNKAALDLVSGTNTGDQVLPTWSTISGKPAVVAEGATQADARTAIGAGTSDLAIGTTGTTAAAGNRAATETATGMVELATTAEATTGTDTTRAVTPAGLKAVADTKAATSHTHTASQVSDSTATGRALVTAADAAAARTAIGAARTVAPAFTAATPAPVLAAVSPAFPAGWTLAAGATTDGTTITLPAGGTMSMPLTVALDQVVQVELTLSASSGAPTVTLGGASASVNAWERTLTVASLAEGSLTLTIGAAGWSATVTAVAVQVQTTRLSPTHMPGDGEVRAWGVLTAIGFNAGYSATTAFGLTAIGFNAGASATTASGLTAIGFAAGASATTASGLTAIGLNAGCSATTAFGLTAIGFTAGASATTAFGLTAIGFAAGASATTAFGLTAIGLNAGYSVRGVDAWATTTGNNQTLVGVESGQGSSTPSTDISTLGYRAIADGDGATAIGANSSAIHAGSVAIGNGTTTTATGQVAVGARDVEVQDATKGLVLRSPDGSRWRATINNAGVIAWMKIV